MLTQDRGIEILQRIRIAMEAITASTLTQSIPNFQEYAQHGTLQRTRRRQPNAGSAPNMIPTFSSSGVLPPFVGNSPAEPAGVSPYSATMVEVVDSLGTTPARAELCRGLLKLRKALREIGIDQGVQWLNGSFCEDVEVTRGRGPNDIDVVTLIARPDKYKESASWKGFVAANLHLFDSRIVKSRYRCDAYFIDLHHRADFTISQITYWFGLFTHQRATHLWKGILQVPLQSDDEIAEEILGIPQT